MRLSKYRKLILTGEYLPKESALTDHRSTRVFKIADFAMAYGTTDRYPRRGSVHPAVLRVDRRNAQCTDSGKLPVDRLGGRTDNLPRAEAIVYSIIVVPVEADAGRNLGGEHALIQISKDTGGKYYYAEGQAQLDEAFRKISEELRTQYLLAYYPSRKISDSPFRRIKVELNKKDPEGQAYQVRNRAGYYTAPAR